jgi:hypothetical protein
MAGTRRLVVRLEAEGEQESLLRFLHARGCSAAAADGATDVSIDDCYQVPPGLAVLVALVDEWRCADRVAEARLQLGDQQTVLRTEV